MVARRWTQQGRSSWVCVAVASIGPTHVSYCRLVRNSIRPAALNCANYVLAGAGCDRRFGTRDDVKVSLRAAIYDPTADRNLIPAASAQLLQEVPGSRLTAPAPPASPIVPGTC